MPHVRSVSNGGVPPSEEASSPGTGRVHSHSLRGGFRSPSLFFFIKKPRDFFSLLLFCVATGFTAGMETFRKHSLSPSVGYLFRMRPEDVDIMFPGLRGEIQGDILKEVQKDTWLPIDHTLSDSKGVFKDSKKAAVQKAYHAYIKSVGAQYHYPVLVQVLVRDKYRYHVMFRHAEDYLEWYVKTMQGEDPPFSVIEIPVPFLKGEAGMAAIKFYCDWEKLLSTMQFLEGDTVLDRVEEARELALRTPLLLIDIMVELGWVKDHFTVQTVVKEGTREVGDAEWKISYHFIFQLLIPTRYVKIAGSEILKKVKEHSASTYEAISQPGNKVTHVDHMSPLIGLDMHPAMNEFQVSLALPCRYPQVS